MKNKEFMPFNTRANDFCISFLYLFSYLLFLPLVSLVQLLAFLPENHLMFYLVFPKFVVLPVIPHIDITVSFQSHPLYPAETTCAPLLGGCHMLLAMKIEIFTGGCISTGAPTPNRGSLVDPGSSIQFPIGL